MRARIFLAALVLIGAGSLARSADEKPLDRTEVDKRVVNAVYEAAVTGTEIFNKGGHAECYRLYQGVLIGVVPMLDHRAPLQTKAKMRLERAAKMKAADAAFELRAALDEIQNEIAPPKKTTLWERLGGQAGVAKVVDEIVLRAAEDKKVNFFRDGKVKLDGKGVQSLKERLVELISENSGGPLKYSGKSMLEAHKGMGITDAEFDAMKAIIVDVLKKYKVAEADIEALGKVVESTRKDIVEKKP
jgi:hemoglobin